MAIAEEAHGEAAHETALRFAKACRWGFITDLWKAERITEVIRSEFKVKIPSSPFSSELAISERLGV